MVRRYIGQETRDSTKSPREKVPNISYLTLFKFSSRCDRILITIAIIASFVNGLIIPYAITLVANVFQTMILYAQGVNAGRQNNEAFLRDMHQFGIHYSCVGISLFIGGYFGTALMKITAINQVYTIRQEYLKAALNQDFSYFDLRQTGDFASRMADDVLKLEEGIGDKVSALVYNVSIAVGCITMALYKGWKLALLCLSTSPVTFILVGITGKLANHLSKKEASASARASAVAQEVLSSIRTVYAFNGQWKELQRYRGPLVEARKVNIKKAFFTGLSMGFLFFCIFGSYAASFYFGIFLIVNDPENYNADVMFSVFFGIMTGIGNLGMVGSLVAAFGAAKGAGAHIFNVLNNVPVINPMLDKGLKPKTAEGYIEFLNVVFHYPTRPSITVLKGINLIVNRGQSIALVGHSGSGKSTVIQLISRYYDVVDGSVRLDGHDVRDLSVNWLRARIGLVSQEPTLFNDTIRENIRYGRDNATDQEIEATAKLANAHNFILKLPKGYDTLVGERGATLSGGQKQRIAIARALLRNPLILLLDEATSALDMASEAQVQVALEKASEGRTTITVAHRLSTIRHADVIYMLDKGEIVEFGTHETLMQNRGPYYDMFVLQEPKLSDQEHIKSHHIEENTVEPEEEINTGDAISVNDEKSAEPAKVSFCRVIALNSPEWKSILVGCICSIIIGFSLPLFVIVFGDMFGAMSDTDVNKLMEKGKTVALTCVVLGTVMGMSNLIEEISFGIAGAYLTERLRVRLFSHMLTQHVGYFDERVNSTGALCARLASEAAYVQRATGQRIGILLQAVSSVCLALIVGLVYEWRVGLVVVCFFFIVAFVIYYQVNTTNKESIGNAESIENSTKIALEAVSNYRTVASLGCERRFLTEYQAQLEPAVPLARRAAHIRAIVAGISRSMFVFMNSAALTLGGHLMVTKHVAYENILVTTQSLQIASGQSQNAFTFAPDFQKGMNAASRIMAELRNKPKINDLETPSVIGLISKGEASFKDVEFRYPSRPKVEVLRRLNFKVESGKTVALVGKSGCGKSTVVQLLQRFYDPDDGVVYLDKYPIPHLRMSEVRSVFGLVSQEPVLFDRTIRENIAYGDNSREQSMDEVIEAATEANIHNFVVTLPEGYETNIGPKGVQLSGGQKQRVAIARALIRRPKILLLDEATSALDTESEKIVLEALEAARSGRTCLTITHRLSTVRDVDLICVIDCGVIVESGSHDQLLRDNGLYASLYHAGL